MLLTGCWQVNECWRLISSFVNLICFSNKSILNNSRAKYIRSSYKAQSSHSPTGEECDYQSVLKKTECMPNWYDARRRHFKLKRRMAAVNLMQESTFRRLAVRVGGWKPTQLPSYYWRAHVETDAAQVLLMVLDGGWNCGKSEVFQISVRVNLSMLSRFGILGFVTVFALPAVAKQSIC